MKNVVVATLLFPRNVVVLLLRGYRAVISPLYGDVCRYHPSCSRYALEAVQEHGLTAGAVLAAGRVCRCHPWAAGGVDDIPRRKNFRYRVTPFGFVVGNSRKV